MSLGTSSVYRKTSKARKLFTVAPLIVTYNIKLKPYKRVKVNTNSTNSTGLVFKISLDSAIFLLSWPLCNSYYTNTILFYYMANPCSNGLDGPNSLLRISCIGPTRNKFSYKPYNKDLNDQACLVKIAGLRSYSFELFKFHDFPRLFPCNFQVLCDHRFSFHFWKFFKTFLVLR